MKNSSSSKFKNTNSKSPWVMAILSLLFAFTISFGLMYYYGAFNKKSYSSDPDLIEILDHIFNSNNTLNSNNILKDNDNDIFEALTIPQNPAVTVVTCSDSEVSIDAIEPTPNNKIFAVKNMGNQILSNEGSIDYGVKVLKTKFLIIIGHTGCSAVKTMIADKKTGIYAIDKELSMTRIRASDIKEATVQNINYQVEQARLKYGNEKVTILGLIHDFKNYSGFGANSMILVNIDGVRHRNNILNKYGDKLKIFNILD